MEFGDEHVLDFVARSAKYLFDKETSDMTFIVQGERLPAHRILFMSSSEYLRAQLREALKVTSVLKVVPEDITLGGFKTFMYYVYNRQLILHEAMWKEDLDKTLEVLAIARMFGLEKLQATLCDHLKQNLSTENVCAIYSKASSLKLGDLCAACEHLIMEEPFVFLESETFSELQEAVLCQILPEDAFCAEEIKIFEAVV